MAKSGSSTPWLVLIVILGAAGAGFYFWQQNRANQPPTFSTTTVTREEIVQNVTASGDLQAVSSVDVSSQISGLMQSVLVDYNSRVKAGDVLAKLDPATYESRLRQARAQLANTQANATLVRLNTERTRSLQKQGIVSQQELDQAEAQLAQAEAQLLIQNASVENAQVDLARCTIYSPIDGIVIDRLTDVGKTVAASLNAPTLFTLVNDLAKMQINAAVSEADIGQVEIGQEVNFTVDAFTNRQFRGRVTQIRNSPKTQQNVVVYATIIAVENEDLKLKPGMTANVSIVVARHANALRVANAALRVRLPEGITPLTPPAPTPAGAGAGASAATTAVAKPPLTEEEKRTLRRDLLREAGFTPGSGAPSPEVLARARALAQARGIEFPGGGGGRGGVGGEGQSGGGSAPTTRTLYRVPTVPAGQPPVFEAITAKLGITDGTGTEVLEGLSEGDRILISISLPGKKTSGTAASPFLGSPPGGGRR